MMVGGCPPTLVEGGEAMELNEVISLITLVILAVELGFHFGQKK